MTVSNAYVEEFIDLDDLDLASVSLDEVDEIAVGGWGCSPAGGNTGTPCWGVSGCGCKSGC